MGQSVDEVVWFGSRYRCHPFMGCLDLQELFTACNVLVGKISLHMEEFCGGSSVDRLFFRREILRSQEVWVSPESGFWKINTDASWFELEGVGGISWVVRDSFGSLILAGCEKVVLFWPIKFLDALALIRGLKALVDYFAHGSLFDVLVESDCVNLINAINHKIQDLSKLSSFVEEMGTLAVSAHVVFFCWCMRSANGLVHRLARAAVLSGDWMRFFFCFFLFFFYL